MNAYDYDVVVVGGGPCGASAAKTAAEKGLKTILLEEHPQIGLPEHCVGVMPGTESGFLEELLKKNGPTCSDNKGKSTAYLCS